MNRDVCGICWCPYDDNGACGCQTLDDAMQQPRAMAQAYENGYKAGVAHEREAIARLIEDAPVLVPLAQNDQGGCMMCGFNPKSAASYIRARGNT